MVDGAGSACWGAFLASHDETTVSHILDAGDETPVSQSNPSMVNSVHCLFAAKETSQHFLEF
jgi:hypothetical protein